MKQRRIGEDSVEMASRQIEWEEILPPHLATAVDTRHFDKTRRPIEADRNMPKSGERLQISSGSATEIEQSEGTHATNVIQRRRDVLRDMEAPPRRRRGSPPRGTPRRRRLISPTPIQSSGNRRVQFHVQVSEGSSCFWPELGNCHGNLRRRRRMAVRDQWSTGISASFLRMNQRVQGGLYWASEVGPIMIPLRPSLARG